jgi:hypothetical protein
MRYYWPIACILCVALILVPEVYAIQTGKLTFSEYIWHITEDWGPLPAVAGLVMGFLICHFWWQSSSGSKGPTGKR